MHKRRTISKDMIAVSIMVGLILMVSLTSAFAAISYIYITSAIEPSSKKIYPMMQVRPKPNSFEVLHMYGDSIDFPFSATLPEFEDLVTDGLVVNLDANNPASYPGDGYWYDTVGNLKMKNQNLEYTELEGLKCFDFNDEVNYFYTEEGSVDFTDSFSVEFWYYTELVEAGREVPLFSCKDSAGMARHLRCRIINYAAFGAGTLPLVDMVDLQDDGDTGHSFNEELTIGGWSNIMIIREGTDDTRENYIYINGKCDDFWSQVNNGNGIVDQLGEIKSSHPLIGKDRTLLGGMNYYMYSGYLSMVRIYDRALSSDEVQQNYEAVNDVLTGGGSSFAWNNLQVLHNDELVDPKLVSVSSQDTISPGQIIRVNKAVTVGDTIVVVYTPTNQVLCEYTVTKQPQ